MDTEVLQGRTKEELLEDWQSALHRLFGAVMMWAEEQSDWNVQLTEKEMEEELVGAYIAPYLTLETPEGELHLETVARVVFGGQGSVELHAWPSLYRVRLVRRAKGRGRLAWSPEDEEWIVLTEGIRWPKPWNKDTFLELAETLLEAQNEIERD